MGTFAKKARAARVWLTALLTLIAGSPRVQCRCPDGRLKPFCLAFLYRDAEGAGCCCGAKGQAASSGSCCQAPGAPSTPEADCPCCAHCCRQPAGEEPGAGRLGAPCCAKTLTPSSDLALTPSATGAEADATSTAALSSPEPCGSPLPEERGLLAWQAHLLAPPPTDLLALLQRLTI